MQLKLTCDFIDEIAQSLQKINSLNKEYVKNAVENIVYEKVYSYFF